MEKVDQLSERLADIGLRGRGVGVHTLDRILADQIIKNPQAHIDALVEAGVLTTTDEDHFAIYYAMKQPHKHEPEAWIAAESGDTVVGCKGCNTMVKVEWPE